MHTTSPASSPEKSSTRGVGEYFIAETFSWEISLLSDGFFLDYFSPQTPFPLRTTDVLTFVWCILINPAWPFSNYNKVRTCAWGSIHTSDFAFRKFRSFVPEQLSKGWFDFDEIWNSCPTNEGKLLIDFWLSLCLWAPYGTFFLQHSSVCWPKKPNVTG